MTDHCLDKEYAPVLTICDMFTLLCPFDAARRTHLRTCTHIYGAQVVSYKCPLVQQARLALLLFEQPVQDLEYSIFVTLVQRFSAISKTDHICCVCCVSSDKQRQQLAYGAKLTGYLTALRNLQIRAAVCSTSSRPVVGACTADVSD